jgi:hypothetical protein
LPLQPSSVCGSSQSSMCTMRWCIGVSRFHRVLVNPVAPPSSGPAYTLDLAFQLFIASL